ncbi:Peptidyl-prolyl cis-trans isomerase CWC27 like protein [Eufriesea mexicana]|uniref:Spliceosome-associated protein CWC27 homolog n=1 Tax=Eufriesea mexicana TaxID=516756 RepID=A0A310SDA4_9HYME|nr:Peptidyl-prolyl cis-trans isomerase CWC27 like protein [Eufriesea mexicana]
MILNNPFSDITPRIIVQESEEAKDNSKTKTAAIKDFNILSFGEEAEEDEEETVILNKKFSDRYKSAHDHLIDESDDEDEFRTKLRSCGRGLIAMANAGKNDNTSQFLFTLGCTSELQSKHTIFGKVTGETIYNVLKLEKTPIDENNRLLYPPRLLKSIILSNPFSVIISRITVENSEEVKDSSKTKTAVVKDFNLLSFAEEAEEDEEECVILNKMFSDKGKSACDHLTDPRLSLQPTVELLGLANKKRKEDHSRDWESNDEIKIAMKERIKNKLMDAKKKPKIVENCRIDDVEDDKDIKENEEGIKNSV